MGYAPADYNIGGKLFISVLVALLLGYLWACFEKERNPLDVLKLVSSGETPPAPPNPSPKKTSTPAPIPPKAPPATPVADPVPKADPAPRVTPASPAIGKSLSPAEVTSLFASIDEQVRRGRILEAREKINAQNKFLIPADSVGRFREYEERVDRYYKLTQETTRGGMIDLPQLWQLFPRSTPGKLVVKILDDQAGSIYYETITGIRSSAKKSDFEIKKLEAPYARAELRDELRKQAGYKGIDAVLDPGQPALYRDKPGKKATGLQFFDLADFCTRNGFNDEIIPLFDEALRRDPDLLRTVHETKADRMVNVLLYFLGINSASDAEKTLDILKERYADARPYQEKVAGDSETQAMIQILLKKGGPIAKVNPTTPPVPNPNPPNPTPQPPVPQPPIPQPPTPQPPTPPEPVDPGPVANPLEGYPMKAREFVGKGDVHFEEAMKHLRRSDPNTNPEGWADENKKALELFMKANSECFLPAQDMFARGAVPQSLLDRVRDTQQRARLCRIRSVSSKK